MYVCLSNRPTVSSVCLFVCFLFGCDNVFQRNHTQVTVHSPICRQDGDLEVALYGSFLPVPSLSVFDWASDHQKVRFYKRNKKRGGETCNDYVVYKSTNSARHLQDLGVVKSESLYIHCSCLSLLLLSLCDIDFDCCCPF